MDFPLTEISVIDGSKRSNKSNAYFSGLGAKKSIVLFDTLIKELSEEEIVAVLAHEVGHYKEKHIYKSMILSVIQIGIMFFLLGYFLKSSSVSRAFGIEIPSFHIALIGFTFLYSPFSSLLGLMMLYISRKNEYEADAYAKKTYDKVSLMTALKKMSVNHLSNLTPHPWYVFFHYSHPPILDRLKSLNQ